MKLSLLFLFLVGCGGVESSEEDLSKSFTYQCNHALKLHVSKTKAKITLVDPKEFSALPDGATFTYDPSYVPRAAHFAGRVKYDWDTDNTVLIMEPSLRTGSTGYLTIEGARIPRQRADFVCRRVLGS